MIILMRNLAQVEKIVFKSDGSKTKFAKEVIPTLGKDSFKMFDDIFQFIKKKAKTDQTFL